MKALFFSLLFSLILCLNSWAAELSATDWDKRIVLRGGLISYDMSGDFSSTKEGQPEIKVDMDDLGLEEDQTTYFLGATFRLGERWRLRLDYFNYDDANDETVSRIIEVDDLVVPLNGKVDSSLDIDLYIANLSYDLYSSERAKFGVGIGAHVVDFDLERERQALGRDLWRFSAASVLSELVLRLAPAERDEALFAALTGGLDALLAARPGVVRGTAAAAIWTVVDVLGFAPDLGGCSRCGDLLESRGGRLDVREGTLACERCLPGGGSLSPAEISVLRRLAAGVPEGPSPSGQQVRLLIEFVRHHAAEGIRLRSLEFLLSEEAR